MSAPNNGDSAIRKAGEDSPLLQTKFKDVSSNTTSTVALSFQDWFSWEVVSAVVAIISMSAIIVVLAIFDNSSLPDWPSIFTINTVVSFFSSIAKLAFMSIVGTCVSQSKWVWYRSKSRPLRDLQAFDDASRGPWGAMGLILSLRAHTLASLGAAIVVLSLLFDPFLQQVVNYSDRLVHVDKEASIVRAQRYLGASYEGLSLPSVVDLSMKAAIYKDMFDADNQANAGTNFQCSTGTCTFDQFASLAVCSKCVNITGMIEKCYDSPQGSRLSLPDRPSISILGGQISAGVTHMSPELEAIAASVVQFTTLFSKDQNDSFDARAWECALFYCVNEYEVSITDGIFQSRTQATWRNDSANAQQDWNLIYNPPISSINITANSSHYYVDKIAAKALYDFMAVAVTGNGSVSEPESGSVFSSDIIHALYQAGSLPSRMNNLAISMSNNIRQQNDSGSDPFEGTALKTETYVDVQWGFFLYSATLVLTSLVFLVGTIVQTRNQEAAVWKSSTLALLYHGERMRLSSGQDSHVNALSRMVQSSFEIKATLVEVEDRTWRLTQS